MKKKQILLTGKTLGQAHSGETFRVMAGKYKRHATLEDTTPSSLSEHLHLFLNGTKKTGPLQLRW